MASRARSKGGRVSLRRHGNPETGMFVATFRDPRYQQDPKHPIKGNKVVRRSLKTHDRAYAEQCSSALERIVKDAALWTTPPEDCPAIVREIWLGAVEDVEVTHDKRALRTKPAEGVRRKRSVALDLEAVDPTGGGFTFRRGMMKSLKKPPVRVDEGDYTDEEKALSFAVAHESVVRDLHEVRMANESLRSQLDAQGTENKALRHRLNLYNKRAARVAKVGTLHEELDKYVLDYKAKKITHKRKGILNSTLKRFVSAMGATRKADDVSEADVTRYVETYRADGGKPISEERRKEIRAQVCTFLERVTHQSFSRRAVGRVSAHNVARERKQIVWLDSGDAKSLLKELYALHGNYWGDLATIQLHMGWRPSELVLLQKSGVKETHLELDPIVDPTSGVSHGKTGGRSIRIPREAAVAVKRRAKPKGQPLLFPFLGSITKEGRTRKRQTDKPGLLSTAWNFDMFYKEYRTKLRAAAKRAKIERPMDARTLRRTFGSLAIRKGWSVEQVAQVMGDRPSTIRRHYARLNSEEVSIDFKL